MYGPSSVGADRGRGSSGGYGNNTNNNNNSGSFSGSGGGGRGGGGSGGDGERKMTVIFLIYLIHAIYSNHAFYIIYQPRGHMSAGANQRPPLSDLATSKISLWLWCDFLIILSDLKLMFEPRAPIQYAKPIVKRKMPPYSGIGQYIKKFELETPPLPPKGELPAERKAKEHEELIRINRAKVEELAKDWEPKNNPRSTG